MIPTPDEIRENRTRRMQECACDHLFGFVAWLTTRQPETKMGAEHDCAPIADLVKKYIATNQLGEPSEGYPHTFFMPESLG